MTTRLLHGDCLEVLKTLEDASVDAIVTDPPYLINFMGKGWDSDDGIAGKPPVWVECLRVLKPGGHLLAFGGTRTYHRMACAIEDAGFEIRDSIHWVYGSGFPKSLNLKDKWEGWGTALKPSHEPVVVARKPLAGTVANTVEQYGTGALNIDGTRVQYASASDMDQARVPQPDFTVVNGVRTHLDATARNGEVFDPSKGRWPTNFLLSHSEDCAETACVEGCPVREMDAQSGPKKASFVRNRTDGARPFNNNGAPTGYVSEKVEVEESEGGASRFFPVFRYQSKASRKEREAGCDSLDTKLMGMSNGAQLHGEGYDKGQDIGLNRTVKVKNNHPTVKPIALMEWLITLVTPPNGTVLDPFMGSGTTGIAAKRLGFSFVGIERDDGYVEIAKARIDAATPPAPPAAKSEQLSLL